MREFARKQNSHFVGKVNWQGIELWYDPKAIRIIHCCMSVNAPKMYTKRDNESNKYCFSEISIYFYVYNVNKMSIKYHPVR